MFYVVDQIRQAVIIGNIMKRGIKVNYADEIKRRVTARELFREILYREAKEILANMEVDGE